MDKIFWDWKATLIDWFISVGGAFDWFDGVNWFDLITKADSRLEDAGSSSE